MTSWPESAPKEVSARRGPQDYFPTPDRFLATLKT